MQALFTLTVSESKRLIARAVVAMPEVERARSEGYLVVGRGSTNAYIVEELLKRDVEKENYTAGQVIRGVLCVLPQAMRSKPVTFHEGRILDVDPAEVLGDIRQGDVLLKGANAVDHSGKVGVLMAGPAGGTMGQFYMAMKAQGAGIIFPVGLEKLVPSVEKAARYGGRFSLGMTVGARTGMACVADGTVITELEAVKILFGLKGVHFASGGFGGAEGSVTLIVEGGESDVKRCVGVVEGIKGEPPLRARKGPCKTCPVLCSFQGKEESELPAYLRSPPESS
jgi:hypothetical protein